MSDRRLIRVTRIRLGTGYIFCRQIRVTRISPRSDIYMIRCLYHKAETILVIFLVRLLKLWALAVAFSFFVQSISFRIFRVLLFPNSVKIGFGHTCSTRR